MTLSVSKEIIMRKALVGVLCWTLSTTVFAGLVGYHMVKKVDDHGREYETIEYEYDTKHIVVPPAEPEYLDAKELRVEEVNDERIKLYDRSRNKTYTIDRTGGTIQ